MINAMEDVPCLIKFSDAATHDHIFFKELDLKKSSYVVFDKGTGAKSKCQTNSTPKKTRKALIHNSLRKKKPSADLQTKWQKV